MAVTATLLTTGHDTTDQASYAGASITTAASRLTLLAVHNPKGTPTTPTVIDSNRTWAQVDTVAFNSAASPAKRVTVFRCLVTATGSFTIDFGGVSQNGCLWNVVEFPGVDTSGSNGSGAIVQHVTGTADSAAGLTITLSAFGSANNATYGAFGNLGTTAITAGSGFTSIDETGDSTPNIRLMAEFQAGNDTSVDTGGGSNNAWGGIAIEIAAAATTTAKARPSTCVLQAVNRSAVF